MPAIRGTRANPRIASLSPIPSTKLTGIAASPSVGDSVWPATTITTNPATDAIVGMIVLWVA